MVEKNKKTAEKVESQIENEKNSSDEKDIQENKILAILCYLGVLFIIPMLLKPSSKFIKFHAKQGLVLTIGWIVGLVLYPVLGVGFLMHIAIIIFSIMGIAAAISALSAKKPGSLLLTYGLSILLAVMVGTQFGISRSQAVAVYPTKYHYGQMGFDETASYLKERLVPNEPIWSMKDIGHYANGTWIENYSSIFKTAAEITHNLQDVIKNKGVRYFVVTKGIGQDRVDAYAELKSALDSCCVIDKEFGNFIIYKAKQHE